MQVAITAALGFDTFLVMRHGAGVALSINTDAPKMLGQDGPSEFEDLAASASERREQRLGCYFCSDVVAPVDVLSFSLFTYKSN